MMGFIVPTLGNRGAFLAECLESIKRNNVSHICVVAPDRVAQDIRDHFPLVQVAVDPGKGLAEAINTGVSRLPKEVTFINWLGDDDRLTDGGLSAIHSALRLNSFATLAFGMCRYVNNHGERIFLNRSGRWCIPLMRFGPQLLSQPAVLFRRKSFEEVGGLDTSLRNAFDLDLLLKLRRRGEFLYVPEVVAEYRWHEDALTVSSRRVTVKEAGDVRRRHFPRVLRPTMALWEPIIQSTSLLAGQVVSSLARRRERK
jgi:GT2 family glycosyltransferase